MGKPVIGVMPQFSAEDNRILIGVNFFNSIEAAGGIPVLLPLKSEPSEVAGILERFDGFLYPGGPDINPLLFGEEAMPEYGAIVPERDRMELSLLPEIQKTGKPVFGICRGLQVMNVALGGALIQDIPSQLQAEKIQPEKRIGHYQKAGNEVMTHLVHVKRGTLLYDIVGKDRIEVNSFHHQSCKGLAKGLVLNGEASDGVIEAAALEHHKFFLGVQWHPEHLFAINEDAMKIWRAFIAACQSH